MKIKLSAVFTFSFLFVMSQRISTDWYGRVAVSYSKGSNKTLYLFDPLNQLANQTYYSTPSLGFSTLINGGIGKMFHKNFGVEANISYLNGEKMDLYSYKTSTNSISAQTKNTQLLFLPTTVFRVDLGKKFHPYIKVGLILPIYNTSRFYYQIEDINNTSNVSIYDYKITNQLNLGINGCVGISYHLTPNIELFIEAEEDNIRSFHRNALLESTTQMGNAVIHPELLPRYTFEKSISTGNKDASKILDFPISFNREAYNLGLKFNF